MEQLQAAIHPPALTILHADSADAGSSEQLVSLACSVLEADPRSGAITSARGPEGTYALIDHRHGFVFISGIPIADANDTSAFDGLQALSVDAGSKLSLALACHFYLEAFPEEGYPAALFAGFQRTFCT